MSETIIEPTGGTQEGTQTATPEPAPSGSQATTPQDGATGGDLSKTVLDPKAADKPVAAPADWPEDWRERMAGEDKAFLNTLKRYTSPLTYAKAGFEAQQKIRSGAVKAPLGEDATPEELAAYRKEHGIPSTPEEYEYKFADGIVPGEVDQPLLDAFKGFAHGKNWTPAQLNDVVGWYYSQQDAISAQRFEADAANKTNAEESLRQEWGPEYRANINAVENFLSGAPEGMALKLLNARASDGSVIGADPTVIRWLANLARESMPGAGLLPAGTSNPTAAMETEIETIQRTMREDPRKYWEDKKMQSRLRDLLEAQQRTAARQ